MPIDIFNPDLQTARRRVSDDLVGRFRSGYQINGRPAALTDWRVTTDTMEVAEAVNELLGGDEPQTWETKGDDDIEVFTTSDSVDIILTGESAIDARMLIWARGQKRLVTCDGSVVDTDGKPHVCEIGGFKNKREHDEQGHVCDPVIGVTFRLADKPDLGLFKFQSSSWSLATAIGRVIRDFRDADYSAKATLALEQVEYESGGSTRRFTKPVLTIVGRHEED